MPFSPLRTVPIIADRSHTVLVPSRVTSGWGLRIGVLEIGAQGYITAFESALPTEKVAVDKNSGVICTPV